MINLPDNPFCIWTENRIKKNKNAMILVNGSLGGGKSYSCIGLSQQISKRLGTNFNVNDNLAFTFTELLEKMKLPQNQAPGTCFIFEEVGSVGSGAASRSWQSKANQFFFSFVQTCRHRNQILFFNAPNYSNIEKGTRDLLHFQLETKGIDFKNKLCFLKPFRIQTNSRTGKTYFKYLRVTYQGKTVKFQQMGVKHPGNFATEQYEKLKLAFTSKLNQSIIDAEKKVTQPQKKVSKLRLKELLEQGLKVKEIAKRLGVSTRWIYELKVQYFNKNA